MTKLNNNNYEYSIAYNTISLMLINNTQNNYWTGTATVNRVCNVNWISCAVVTHAGLEGENFGKITFCKIDWQIGRHDIKREHVTRKVWV